MLKRLLLLAIPGALLALVLSDPQAILGEWLGRQVIIGKNLVKIIGTMGTVSPKTLLPQLAALDFVLAG